MAVRTKAVLGVGRSWRLVVTASALLGGCQRDLLSGPSADAGMGADLVGSLDLARTGDLQGVCTRHSQRRPVPLDAIALVDDPPLQQGAALRFVVTYTLGVCEVAADIQTDFQIGNAADAVKLTAKAWTPDAPGPACRSTYKVTRVFVLPPGGPLTCPTLHVFDGAGGPASLTVAMRATPAGATCATAAQPGQPCQLDCQCQRMSSRVVCVHVDGGGHGVCEMSCGSDPECVDGVTTYCDLSGKGPGARYTCVAPPPRCSCDGARCLHGQGCGVPGAPACSCHSTSATNFGGPCQCDADCGPGALCGGAGYCLMPCTVVFDCPPEGLFCDQGACLWGV